MTLTIETTLRHDQQIWRVHAYGATFDFIDQTSAEAFARKLEERVNAPHELPRETVGHWAAEHYRMLRGS
jgi:hypothetical protein